ncbi:cytidylyltransferase domain-containing protein [Campylobacter upsaliensis]|nr:hypothetical protein [Campylobacter upsaliensis]
MFSAIIPIRKSEYQFEILPCNAKNLLERKVSYLKKIDLIKEIIIASNCDLKQEAINLGVKFYLRSEKESNDDVSIFVKNIATQVKNKHIIYAYCNTPLFDEKCLLNSIEKYLSLDFNTYDSLITCTKLQSFIFDENGAFNFKNIHTNSKNIPTLYQLLNACFIMSKELNLRYAYHFGKIPFKELIHKKDSFEIKDKESFIFFKNILDKKERK